MKPCAVNGMAVDGSWTAPRIVRILRCGLSKHDEEERPEVLIETFIRKQLRLKSHTVTKVEESEEWMTVYIDRLGRRLLRCGLCRQRCREVYDVCKEPTWRDLSMRKLSLRLCYRPRRVDCPRCGGRVEDCPWAEPWGRPSSLFLPGLN